MDHEQIRISNWWQRNWKWLLGVVIFFTLIITLITSGAGTGANDLAQAYTDKKLFDDAIEMARNKEAIVKELGELKPLAPLAILEGQVEYTNKRYSIKSTVRITGTRGRALMDISADRINKGWDYKTIQIRIKHDSGAEQKIDVFRKEP